jgi:hypothetical protein
MEGEKIYEYDLNVTGGRTDYGVTLPSTLDTPVLRYDGRL